jgi:type IV secretory pathway VirB6-like protein
MDLCYYSEDIGNIGNTDLINLAAAENNCYYDNFKSYGENGNLSIKNCLSTTSLPSIKNSYATLSGDFEKFTTVGDNPIENAKCSDADPMDNGKVVVGANGIEQADANAAAKTVYLKCVEHCINSCESNSTPEEAMWTKASIKTDSTYVGIKLNRDVFVTITATGSIKLDSTSSTVDMDFNVIGVPDTRYKQPIARGNSSLDLKIKVKKNAGTAETAKINTMENLDNIREKIHLSFTAAKENLIPLSSGEAETKLTQQPNFRAFKCSYDIDEFEQGSANCSFNYTNLINSIDALSSESSTLANKLDSYYSSSDNLPAPRVFNGDYHRYANDRIKHIEKTGTISQGGSSEPFTNRQTNFVNFVSYEGTDNKTIYIKQKLGPEILDGFLWNDSNESFRIVLGKRAAIKIAIKYIGSRSNDNNICSYSVEDPKKYMANDSDKTGELTKGIYSVSYDISASLEEKWQVLKDSDGHEIVFNQFLQEDNTGTDYIITIAKSGDNNSPLCSRGLLIKLLPMKDYDIGIGGLMFFHIPDVTISSGDTIKYTLLNPAALTTSGMDSNAGKNLYYKIDEFFEDQSNRTQFADESIGILGANELEDLDNDNLNTTIMSKSIFVRKGQKLRLDYSNWLKLDGLKDIEIKTTSTIAESKFIGYGLGLSIFIKERPLYFCYGSAKETYNLENRCKTEGGTFGSVEIGEGQEKGVCTLDTDACMIGEEFTTNFTNMSYTDSSCVSATNSLNADQASNAPRARIASFWNNVYSSYEACKNIPIGHTCYSDCIEPFITHVYEKAIECSAHLNSANSGYLMFTSSSSDNGENSQSYKTPLTSLPEIASASNIEDKIDALKSFFNTQAENNTINTSQDNSEDSGENSSTGYTSYKSQLDYYRNFCSETNGSNMACTNDIIQCYDASNYRGRLKNLISRISTNVSATTESIDESGKLTNVDIKLGAAKLHQFSGDEGIIKNLEVSYTDSNADNDYFHMKYNRPINLNGTYFATFFILRDFEKCGTTSTSSFMNKLRECSISELKSDAVVKIIIGSSRNYVNGERLAVFMGYNNKAYFGNPNQIQFANGSSNINTTYKGSMDTSNRIVNIVKYCGNSSDDYELCPPCTGDNVAAGDCSKYRFDTTGTLKSNNGRLGVEFSDEINFAEGNSYLEADSSSTKNLFFKIIDIDSSMTDNSGSYQIKIRTINKSENIVITYFRNFFNTVLGFVDGSIVRLSVNSNGGKRLCDENDTENGACFIYNNTDVINNGNECHYKSDDTESNMHCFKGCGFGTAKCEEFYDGRGFVKNIYENFINDPLYQFIAKLSLVLMIIFYGFGYFFGLSSFTQSEIIPKIIKVCFIYFIISPNGWDFFNNYIIKFFKAGVDSVLFLIAGSFEMNIDSDLSLALARQDFSDKSVIFSTCFSNLELIFSDPVICKILGLAFSSWFGLIYLYLVLVTVINYIIGVFSAIIMYLNSQVYMSLVFCFFPLVVLFMFFEKTKKTFDNWLNLLIGFAGQQIFLVMTLSFFNMIIYNFIISVFNYTVCWLPILNMNIAGIPLSLISFWKIPNTSLAGINTINEGMPTFYSIMTFYIVGVLMSKFVTGATELGQNIFGGGMGIGGGIAGIANKALESGGNAAKKFMKDTGIAFGKGMADRMGGRAIRKYGEEQSKKRTDKAQRRDKYFKDAKSGKDKKMSNYKNSSAFQNDIAKERKDNYNSLSDKDKKKEDEKIAKTVLDKKSKEFEKEAKTESILNNYGEEMQKSMNKNGVDKDLNSLDETEQKKFAEEFGKNMGLL